MKYEFKKNLFNFGSIDAFSSLIVVSANNLKSVEIISSDVGTESGQEISGVGSSFMIDNDGSISANNPKDVKNVTKFEGTVNINISSLNDTEKQTLQDISNDKNKTKAVTLKINDTESNNKTTLSRVNIKSASVDGNTLTVSFSATEENRMPSKSVDMKNPQVTSFGVVFGNLEIQAKLPASGSNSNSSSK